MALRRLWVALSNRDRELRSRLVRILEAEFVLVDSRARGTRSHPVALLAAAERIDEPASATWLRGFAYGPRRCP